jgi:CHAT domain-containing protein/predicted Zn-dependent protease
MSRLSVQAAGLIWLSAAATFVACKGDRLESGDRALAQAFSKRRLVEPRISGLPAGHFKPQQSEEDLYGIDLQQLSRAIEIIGDQPEGSPQKELALGRLQLARGRLNESAALLRKAVVLLPDSPQAHNDLGACLLARGDVEGALGEFERALELDPSMPEALFNRALSYQRLLLIEAARAEFKRIKEEDKGWLEEIGRRLEELSRLSAPKKSWADIIADFRAADIEAAGSMADRRFEELRLHALLDLVTRHLRASVERNQSESERALSELTLIGELLAEKKGDRFLADLARYLRSLSDLERTRELKLIERFNEAVRRAGSADSLLELRRLREQFRARKNEAFEVLSAFNAARSHYLLNQHRSSAKLLEELLPQVRERSWLYEWSRVLMQLGIANSRLGSDSIGIKLCEQAAELCRKMGESAGKPLQYISVARWHLGDLDGALAALRESTRSLLEYDGDRIFLSGPYDVELANNYLHMADIYRLKGISSLARLYAEQSLTFCNMAKDLERAAQASSFLAVEYAKINQFGEADRYLGQAFGYLDRMAAGLRQAYTETLILTRAGEIAARRGQIREALRYYSRAEILASRSEEGALPLIRVLRGRAEAYAASGQFGPARSDLMRAAKMIESYRAKIVDSADRASFLDISHSVFDRLIALHIESFADEAGAFYFAERARARTLLEEFPGQSEPLKLDQVQRALPDDLLAVSYAVTDQRTYVFLIGRRLFKIFKSDIAVEELDRLVSHYLSAIREKAPPEELIELAAPIYRILIEPVEGWLKPNICIIPDKSLHFLPFASLTRPGRQYLIYSHSLGYAPSASALVQCLKEAARKPGAHAERVIAVGNPLFDRREFDRLEYLPGAEREARQVASLYGDSIALIGSQATEQQVRSKIRACDLVHLASHCIIGEGSQAALVLAKGGGDPADDGLLRMNEVGQLDLSKVRLVVLSACQTALGQYYRGEGILSLARYFIVARVPTVLASLWQVNSEATADLMIEFHRQKKAGLSAGQALRAAQVKLSQSGSFQHPYYWASFVTIGSQ